jgi:hypothetical protein
MTLTTHPLSAPDALVATLPSGTTVTDTITPPSLDSRPPVVADPSTDRLGTTCGTCIAGTYAAGPGAGHVTCDTCGHASVRRGVIGRPRRHA